MSLLRITATDREEIVALASIFADGQNRLQQLLTRLENGDKATESLWETRYNEMQKLHKEAVNSAKWLRVRNVELERKLEQHQPALDRAISAREGAFHKIKHTRKVIRDLLQERRDMGSPSNTPFLTQDAIDEALGDVQDDSSSSSCSSSSRGLGSDRTVRLGTVPPSHMSSPSSKGSQLSPLTPHLVTHFSNFGSQHSSPQVSQSDSFMSSQTLVHSPRSPNNNRVSPDGDWYIQFKKPPGSSAILEGPISWASLESSLRLSQDTIHSLESLSTSVDISIRLQITQLEAVRANVAFLYDPIFVDNRRKTYILDWGRQHTNQNVAKYISGNKGPDSIFHVFTFPIKEKNWYYIGAHHWAVVQIADFWPLEGNSRKKMITKLCKRSGGEVDEAEMGRLLDSGELKQLCVELTGVRDTRITHDFAADVLGHRSPSYSEPRHERRVEGVKE